MVSRVLRRRVAGILAACPFEEAGRAGAGTGVRRSSGGKVLDLVAAGRPVIDVARDLGISTQSIYSWRRQDRIDKGLEPGLSSAEKAELWHRLSVYSDRVGPARSNPPCSTMACAPWLSPGAVSSLRHPSAAEDGAAEHGVCARADRRRRRDPAPAGDTGPPGSPKLRRRLSRTGCSGSSPSTRTAAGSDPAHGRILGRGIRGDPLYAAALPLDPASCWRRREGRRPGARGQRASAGTSSPVAGVRRPPPGLQDRRGGAAEELSSDERASVTPSVNGRSRWPGSSAPRRSPRSRQP
jgi:hypothetical protein